MVGALPAPNPSRTEPVETGNTGATLAACDHGARSRGDAIIIDFERSALTAGTGMTRREALAAAAGGLVLASCGESFGSLEPDAPEPPAFVKDPSNFIVHGSNLEARLEDMDGLLTPVDRFFVRNHSPTPIIDADAYRLSVGGLGAERNVELSLADLRALPSHTVVAYLECAGNWRRFFESVLGQAAAGSQWGTGAIGCAEWSGPRLRDVLALAGLRAGAVDVNLHGLDDSAWQRPMPLAKAMDDDTLLAAPGGLRPRLRSPHRRGSREERPGPSPRRRRRIDPAASGRMTAR